MQTTEQTISYIWPNPSRLALTPVVSERFGGTVGIRDPARKPESQNMQTNIKTADAPPGSLHPVVMRNCVTLTVAEIQELAEFAGIRVDRSRSPLDDSEMEITIEPCPEEGIAEEDGSRGHYRHIAYYEDYPEEGAWPLGPHNDQAHPTAAKATVAGTENPCAK